MQRFILHKSLSADLPQDFIPDIEAVGRRMGERAGESCAVSDRVDAPASLQFEVPGGGARRIIFAFNAIEQGIIVCRSGRNGIQSVQRLDDIVKLALGCLLYTSDAADEL